MMATGYLLERVSWADISSEFIIDLTASRTRQLCDAMTVPKDLMANLFLAAGGRGGISTGGAVPTVNFPTGTEQRRMQVGEYKRCFFAHNIKMEGVIFDTPHQ